MRGKKDCGRVILWVSLVLCVTSGLSFADSGGLKASLSDIPQQWTEITPGSTEFMGRRLNPGCSGAPRTDPSFRFFFKGGTKNNLVVFFDGGGACWDAMNCIYAQTFSPEVDETVEDLTRAGGIFDFGNPANPFRDWNFAFVPYCTGDIHWGSADHIYPGLFGEGKYTIRHRGFDNFLAVLKWILEHVDNPQKIFVTGSSAGSYGALLGFPYIQEAYPHSKAMMLGDAGFGVVADDFRNVGMQHWGFQANVPAWIPGFEKPFSEYTLAEMHQMVAAYYPFSRMGQYTTAWDAGQTFFYNVMLHAGNPLTWENFAPVWCDWHDRMLELAHDAAQAPNYRYYIGSGTDHTIMAYDKFYTESSAGILFLDWIKGMIEHEAEPWDYDRLPWLNGDHFVWEWVRAILDRMRAVYGNDASSWSNLECTDCEAPIACP